MKYQFGWFDRVSNARGMAVANTKSEARAVVKKELGVRSHGRLPITIVFLERIAVKP